MKIFWQNMVKISEEKQLIALAMFAFFRWGTTGQLLLNVLNTSVWVFISGRKLHVKQIFSHEFNNKQ